MEKMKRFIDCYIPITKCNLKCHYCYITQYNTVKEEQWFKYSPEIIGKALSKERLGGICHINMCGGGETLIPSEIVDVIKNILTQGHYIMVVTNGTLTRRFDELCELPEEMRKRLGFKFSFHYLELKRLNKLEEFFDNVNKMKNAGCSFSVELVPCDEIVEYIPEIKKVCMEKVGALCHVTVARDNADPDLNILTKNSIEEYKKIWGDNFNSSLFDFKMSTFNVKRREFCYAGDWTLYLNLGTGGLSKCQGTPPLQNIFEDVNEPIKFQAIGNNCMEAHCYNSHAFMGLGAIPSVETPKYADMRNRVAIDGTEWLNHEMKAFLGCKLKDMNVEYSTEEKKKANHASYNLKFREFAQKSRKLARRLKRYVR